MPVSNTQLRKAIASNIQQAVDDLYITNGIDSDMQVVIRDHWILTTNVGRTAAILKPREGTDFKKVHGWLIGSASKLRQNERVGDDALNLFKFNRGCSSGKIEQDINRRKVVETFKIWTFQEMDVGTPDDETNENSENRLTREIEHVVRWFSKYLLLGIDDKDFYGHTEMQFQEIGQYNFGESIVSGAKGSLTVAYYDRII